MLKIYIIPVPDTLQPSKQNLTYPPHNKDYGVEQDFLVWLRKNSYLLTSNPNEATWHYLPIFWTRWHINHNFAENKAGLCELRTLAEKVILNDEKTFTITQFDGGMLIDLGKTVDFSAGKTVNEGIDIPLLCSLHKTPLFPVRKKFIGTFNGSFDTHPIRKELRKQYKNNPSINVGSDLPTCYYKARIQGHQFNLNIMASYLAICPRGTNATSFRFFEAMQFGVAPCLVGDIDVRPFKKFINWDEISYYVDSIEQLDILLTKLDKKEAIMKGKLAEKVFFQEIYYQKWCKYVLKELDDLTNEIQANAS